MLELNKTPIRIGQWILNQMHHAEVDLDILNGEDNDSPEWHAAYARMRVRVESIREFLQSVGVKRTDDVD